MVHSSMQEGEWGGLRTLKGNMKPVNVYLHVWFILQLIGTSLESIANSASVLNQEAKFKCFGIHFKSALWVLYAVRDFRIIRTI